MDKNEYQCCIKFSGDNSYYNKDFYIKADDILKIHDCISRVTSINYFISILEKSDLATKSVIAFLLWKEYDMMLSSYNSDGLNISC